MLSYLCGMKAFFDITLPTSWASLTDRQLRYAYRQIARGLSLPAITALCLLKWGELQVKFQHPKGIYHIRCRRSRETAALSLSQLTAAAQTLNWLGEIPSEPIRLSRIGRHRALPADFQEVPFEKFLCADNLYQGYLHTDNPELLNDLAAVLYDARRMRLSNEEMLSVFYWFLSLKHFFAKRFPHFLKPEVSSDNLLGYQPDIAKRLTTSMNAQIRALTGGDITKESTILQTDTWRALTELDAKAADAEEFEKISKQHK